MDDMNYNQDQWQAPVQSPPPNNTLGIVSLASGIAGLIFSICCYPLGIILAILAIICGIIGNQRGQKFALAGIILGAISLILALVFILLGAVFFEPIMDEIIREIERQQF